MSIVARAAVTAMTLAPKALVWQVARRYVAGVDLKSAIDVVRELNRQGAMATVDLLGEEVVDRTVPEEAVQAYVAILEAIDREKLESNVSLKPTQLGLNIDEAFCRKNAETVIQAAKSQGNFVRIDMEDRTTTDATLDMYRQFLSEYGNVGCVLQSCMRRTLRDIRSMPEEGTNIRLCKGIYVEPREVAWKGHDTIRRNFVAALEMMFQQGIYVGIATHDEYLICAASELIHRYKLKPSQYEFQMLYGVDAAMRKILIERGHRMRIYVPYGQDWYLYSVRRLRENPQIAGHVLRSFFKGSS